MDPASIVMGAFAAVAGLALAAWLFLRLMRWARSSARGAHALGAVLTEVTQSAVVREAKQGTKRNAGEVGDPPDKD
jgi:hypothetical protein